MDKRDIELMRLKTQMAEMYRQAQPPYLQSQQQAAKNVLKKLQESYKAISGEYYTHFLFEDENKGILDGLSLPVRYESGSIVDGTGKVIIKANRDSQTTSLPPTGRDALLKLVVELLNDAFEHDKASQILKKLGY